MAHSSPRLGLFALVFVLVTLLRPFAAWAGPPPGAPADARPVIVGGREDEVMALFAPHQFGDELVPGWKLHSVDIDIGTITAWVVGPDEVYAQVTFDHLDYAPPEAQRLSGFAAKVVDQPRGSETATAELIALVDRNDGGKFWGSEEVVYAGEPREHPYELNLEADRWWPEVERWLRDGLVFYVFVALLLVIMTTAVLREAPLWARLALVSIVVVAAILRLTISPRVAFDPWPYSRLIASAGRIFHGPALALLYDERVWLTEVITASTLAYALLAPLAIFVHARLLLADLRTALIAAAVIAILPLHLRFAFTDTAFIPSITVSSTTFCLVHIATRDRSRLRGWLAVVLVGLPLSSLVLLRPLNIIYFPLMLATAFVNQGLFEDRPKVELARTIVCFSLITAVALGFGLPHLLSSHGGEVSEGLSITTLLSGLRVLVSVRYNALVNPVFSPPGLTALAVLGGVDLWRRERKMLLAYVLGWLLAFLVAHAYIMPESPYMQARYHLHLVVPYIFLVAVGASAALRWLAEQRELRSWLAGRRYDMVRGAAVLYVALSPAIHLHAITFTKLNDTQEWLFVRSLRDQIPAECTIIEYTGVRAGMRFERVGTSIKHGVERKQWWVHEILQANEGEDDIPARIREILEDPPECLYWYEGLPCFGVKAEHEGKAPACHAIEGFVRLEEVAMTEFPSVPYDENLAHGLGDQETVQLRLFRAIVK